MLLAISAQAVQGSGGGSLPPAAGVLDTDDASHVPPRFCVIQPLPDAETKSAPPDDRLGYSSD